MSNMHSVTVEREKFTRIVSLIQAVDGCLGILLVPTKRGISPLLHLQTFKKEGRVLELDVNVAE